MPADMTPADALDPVGRLTGLAEAMVERSEAGDGLRLSADGARRYAADLRAVLRRLEEASKWEAFGREMFDTDERGDWDGGEIQDVAEKHGVLIRTTVTAPCDPEHCVCAESGDFPLECFRLSPPAAAPRPDAGGAG